MALRLEQIDTPTASETVLAGLHRLHVEWDAEQLPQDPPMPFEQRLLDWSHLLESEAVLRWILWDGDEVVATSGLHLDLEQNLDNAWGWVYVATAHRGRGLGRRVAVPMLEEGIRRGRARLGVEIVEGRPEQGLAQRAGMRAAYRERRSRLDFTTVDWDLMDDWVFRAEERASEYHLVFLPSPIEERYLEAYCRVYAVMNTAPREDYIEEDEELTPAVWRDIEAQHEKRRLTLYTYLAFHRPTGEPAGFTTLAWQQLVPDLAWQADTGVDPAHRNKGLGRWLKASMALHLRREHPELRRIDTFNAGSNAPMLSINVAMGFRPLLDLVTWQGDLASVRERLGW